MRIASGVTDQVIYFVAVDSTDFTTRETGLTTFTVYRSRNTTTATVMTTPTVTQVSATNMPGVYTLLLDEDMTIGSGNDTEEMTFHITQAAMAPVTRSIELYRPKITIGSTSTAQTGDSFARLAAYRLGELMSAALASQPFAASLLADLTQDNAGTQQFTPDALDRAADILLTGATHNIPTSWGRRVRGIQEFQGYEGGAVWIDTINGTAGTIDFENGTVENPVDSIADANTIAASLGFSRFHILPGSSITFAATQANQVFEGNNWTLALGGQSIVGTTIIGAAVSGIASGVGTTQIFRDCNVGATSHVKGTHLLNSGLSGTQTVIEAGEFFFDLCHSAMPGMASVTFDFGALLNSSDLHIRHHSGGWTIENMGAGTGTYESTFEGNGQIIWAASCSATSNASVRGHWKITDNASGAVVVTKSDLQTNVDAILVDTGTTIPALIGTPTDTDIATDIVNVQTVADLAATAAALAVVDGNVDDLKLGIILGTAVTGTLSTTQATTDLTGFLDGELVNRTIVFTGGQADGQAATITAYAAASGLVTFSGGITTAPLNLDTIKIV